MTPLSHPYKDRQLRTLEPSFHDNMYTFLTRVVVCLHTCMFLSKSSSRKSQRGQSWVRISFRPGTIQFIFELETNIFLGAFQFREFSAWPWAMIDVYADLAKTSCGQFWFAPQNILDCGKLLDAATFRQTTFRRLTSVNWHFVSRHVFLWNEWMFKCFWTAELISIYLHIVCMEARAKTGVRTKNLVQWFFEDMYVYKM
jgi:hypothetical protein